jgi:protein-tyrosine phosphatase
MTVGNRAIPKEKQDGFVYMFVDAQDSPAENLLKHLADCFDFIDEALNRGPGVLAPVDNASGGILVHCHQGYSRSAAVVIGYIMSKEKLSYAEAFASVRKKRIIGPNPGFVHQLQMFEAIEWDLKDLKEFEWDVEEVILTIEQRRLNSLES